MPGRTCAVATCKNNQVVLRRKGAKIIFHSFPLGKDIVSSTTRKEWVHRCNRADDFNVKSSTICSDHFTNEDYERDLQNELLGLPLRKCLKKTAVPTLYLGDQSFEETIQERVHERRTIKRRNRKVIDACSTTEKSRKPPRQGTVSSRATKIRSKKSTNIQNEDTEDQMDDNDDHTFVGPKVTEFENDNKFEVLYLEPEKDEVFTKKSSKCGSETDDASEGSNGFDSVQELLDSRCQKTEQISFRFRRLCRICSATRRLIHLQKCRSQVALFVSITNIEIEVEDNLPKYMCADCVQKLDDISNFISVAKKNDAKLKQAMLSDEEMKNDLSDNEVEESLNLLEDISNVPQEVFSKSSDVTIPNNFDLLENRSKKPQLKKDEKDQNIDNKNGEDVHDKSSKIQTSKQSDYFSDKKNDCICWKCGEVYVGLRIPKVIEDLPVDMLKFHCLNCSKPSESPDKEAAIDDTNLRPFKANACPKVYPGKTSRGEEKKIRCMTCLESFAVSKFVAHQLQTHSVKKKYTCKLCFSSFSHPSLLRRHATRHT